MSSMLPALKHIYNLAHRSSLFDFHGYKLSSMSWLSIEDHSLSLSEWMTEVGLKAVFCENFLILNEGIHEISLH